MRLTSKSSLMLLTLGVSCVALSSTAFADAKDGRIAAMEAQMQIMMQEIQSLKSERAQEKQQQATLQKQVQNLQDTTAQQIAAIKPAAGETLGSGVKVTMKSTPKFESADGQYSFQPFGRVHADVTAFQDDKFDHASGADLRRARLGFKGKLGKDFSYKTQVDFADEGVDLKEVSLTYSGFDTADIKVGNHKPQLGLQNRTSSNNIQLIERSAPSNAFTRSEILGIAANGGGDDWSWSVGVFNEDAGNDDTGDDEDISVDATISTDLLQESDHVVHVGAGISHRRPTGNVRFRIRPTGEGNRIIDTGNFAAVDNVNVYNAQTGVVFGPFSAQAEYFNTQISRNGGNADADFDGYYAQASYILTGETRGYTGKNGKFGTVKPNNPLNPSTGDWGAVEIVGRYENANLNDMGAGIMGGEADIISGGLTWYLNNHTRLMTNVVAVDTDNNAVVPDDDPVIYNTRAQWKF